MRFDIPFRPPMPRFASVNGGTEVGDDPSPAAPSAPIPQEPEPSPTVPEPEALPIAAQRTLTPLEELNSFLLDENLRLSRAHHRVEMALVAALLSVCPTLNWISNTVSRLEPGDWRTFRDLAGDLHRQTTELSAQLAPLCRQQQPEPGEKPRLAVVS
jgi:hypothetical protein